MLKLLHFAQVQRRPVLSQIDSGPEPPATDDHEVFKAMIDDLQVLYWHSPASVAVIARAARHLADPYRKPHEG